MLFLLLVLACFAAESHAGVKKILTSVPRAIGRNYANMFNFKHPWLAAQQWAIVGAVLFDEKTTQDRFNRCSRCVEANPFAPYYNGRTGTRGAVLDSLALITFETTMTNYTAELTRNDPSRGWRNAYSIIPVTYIGVHSWAGWSNKNNR